MKLILIGMLSGIITGLGMGGGSILILLLTAYMNVNQHTAQATNLIYFIPTAIMAIIIHFKNGNVDKFIGKKLLFSVIAGATLGGCIVGLISSNNLKKYFGIFLLLVGIFEMISTIRKIYKDKRKDEK